MGSMFRFGETNHPVYSQFSDSWSTIRSLAVLERFHNNANNASNATMLAPLQTIFLPEEELFHLPEEEEFFNKRPNILWIEVVETLRLAVKQYVDVSLWMKDLPPLFDNDWNIVEPRQRPHPNCVACGEEAGPSNHFTTRKITSTCEHAPSICKLCLQHWIETQLEGTAWDKIACPECTEVLSHANIKLHATKAVFER